MFGNAAFVGLYSMATTVANAPWRQFSSQVGQVLFAAAASEPETSHERTTRSVELMSMLMLPLLPVGIVIAPAVLPGVLGPEWAPMVHTFQVLFIVGIGNAVVNCIAEPLTGMGYMPFRAKLMVAQCVATLVALAVLVPVGGILGAATAQLIIFVPYAAVYFTAGARRADTSAAELWASMRPAVKALIVQLVVTAAAIGALVGLGTGVPVAECVAAVIGWAAAVPVIRWHVKRERS
jgi:O-antigen/teichoic acid export membrane protein